MRNSARPPATPAIAFLAALVVALPAAQAQDLKAMNEKDVAGVGGVRLTGQQIVAAFSGNSVIALKIAAGPVIQKGATVNIYFRDARTRISHAGKPIESLWWIDGDLLCAENKVERVGHVCASIYRFGTDYLHCERGTPVCEWQLRVLPGNAFKF